MCPTRVSGIVTWVHQSANGQSFYLTLVTDPEVFANVNSAQFPAGFLSDEFHTAIECFRLWDENDYEYEILFRFSQYWVLLTREPAPFRRENVMAVVVLPRVLAKM